LITPQSRRHFSSEVNHGIAAVRKLAFGHVAAQSIASTTSEQETIIYS
jgi:hypothetical protein